MSLVRTSTDGTVHYRCRINLYLQLSFIIDTVTSNQCPLVNPHYLDADPEHETVYADPDPRFPFDADLDS